MDNLLHLLHVLGNNLGGVMSIRQLAMAASIPYTSTLRTVNQHSTLFVIRKLGNANLISLNGDDVIVKNYLIVAEREVAIGVFHKQPFLKSLYHDIRPGDYSLVLFGSRAQNDYRDKSDVDLCVISKDGARVIGFSKFEMLSGVEVNPLYFSDSDFIDMITSREHTVGKEILNKHIVLYGEEYYWDLVWEHVF